MPEHAKGNVKHVAERRMKSANNRLVCIGAVVQTIPERKSHGARKANVAHDHRRRIANRRDDIDEKNKGERGDDGGDTPVRKPPVHEMPETPYPGGDARGAREKN